MIRILIAIIIITLPWMKVIGGINMALSDIFMPIILLILILKKRKMNKSNKIKSILIYEYMLLTFILISFFISIFKFDKVGEDAFLNIFKLIISFLYLNVFYIILKRDKEDFLFMIKIWVYNTVVNSIIGIVAFIVNEVGIETIFMYGNRLKGSFEDPNLYACYLFIGFGLCIYLKELKKENILSIEIIVIIIAILLTGSRGALVTLGCIALILLMKLKRKNKIGIIIIISLLVIIAFKTGFFETILNRVEFLGDKGDVRFKLWEIGFKLSLLNPFFGVGIGNFIYAGNYIFDENISNLTHNTYLNILSENGVIVFLIFFSIYMFFLRKMCSKKYKNLGLLISLVSVLVFFLSLNLENFRCIWALNALIFYYFEEKEIEIDSV